MFVNYISNKLLAVNKFKKVLKNNKERNLDGGIKKYTKYFI